MSEVIENVICVVTQHVVLEGCVFHLLVITFCCCSVKMCAFHNTDQKLYPHTLISGPLTHCHSAFGECFTTPPFSKYLILLTCSLTTLLLAVHHPRTLLRCSLSFSSRCTVYLKEKFLENHIFPPIQTVLSIMALTPFCRE